MDEGQGAGDKSGSTLTLWDAFGYEKDDYARRRLLTPSLPNRFLAVLPAEKAADIAREVADEVRATHERIAEAVWTWGAKNLPAADCWSDAHRQRFNAQNERFLDISWQVLPWPATPDEAYEITAALPEAGLDITGEGPRTGLRTILKMASKQDGKDRDFRNFECPRLPSGTRNAKGADIGGWKDKSKLKENAKLDNPGAAWSALYRLADRQLDAVRHTRAWKAWTDGGWRAGMELAKDALNGKEENLLDLRGTQDAEKLAETLNRTGGVDHLFKIGEILGATSLVKRLWPVACLMGQWVSGTHDNMPRLKTQISSGALAYMQKNMADLLDPKRPLSSSFHLQFSEMLANFGHYCAGRIVEAFGGWLIYAGGDDVLALLPAHNALSCAVALRAAFKGDPKRLLTLRSLDGKALFDFEQQGFIKLHADAPCCEGEPKKFHVMVPGPAADCSAGIAMAHFKSPLQDVVREAQRAEKRAKREIKAGGLGRSAVAVTLMKRSGETIEWGCRWDHGGLEAFRGMLDAIARKRVSAKFPHRIVELVDGYRVSGGDAMNSAAPRRRGSTWNTPPPWPS